MRLLAILVIIACGAAAGAAETPSSLPREVDNSPTPTPTPQPKPTLARNTVCPIDGQPIDARVAPVELKEADCPHHPELVGALIGTCSDAHRQLLVLNAARYEEAIWQVCRRAEIAKKPEGEK